MISLNKHLTGDFAHGISYEKRGNRRIVMVDMKKARFRHMPWHSLGGFGKRKFENLLVLTDTRIPTKVVYL